MAICPYEVVILLISMGVAIRALVFGVKLKKDSENDESNKRTFRTSKEKILQSLFVLCASILIELILVHRFGYKDVFSWVGLLFIIVAIVYVLLRLTSKICLEETIVSDSNIFAKNIIKYSEIKRIFKNVETFGDGSDSESVDYQVKTGGFFSIDNYEGLGFILRIINEKSELELTEEEIQNLERINKASKLEKIFYFISIPILFTFCIYFVLLITR